MIIVAGDLHANALKLILLLSAYNIVSLSEKQKNELKSAYIKNDTAQFQLTLYDLKFQKKCQRKIIFLGDLLADRGKNDWFVLCILQKMAENLINYEIIYSNHDAQFINNILNLEQGRKICVAD